MRVICQTNLDLYKKYDWPTEMVCRPLVGDWVESTGGARLKVCGVTHTGASIRPTHSVGTPDPPFLLVDLHH